MGAGAADDIHVLHERLLRDRRIQFEFQTLDLTPPRPPKWLLDLLGGIGKALEPVAPILEVVLVVAVVLGLMTVLYLTGREVFGGRRRPGHRRARREGAAIDFTPDRRRALILLEDADRLAAEDRFDEAARLILRRSIEDIDSRRPRLVRPALTAREIAGLAEVPPPARSCFAIMAAIVERSAFAGRRLGRAEFLDCRGAYERFAFPEAWA